MKRIKVNQGFEDFEGKPIVTDLNIKRVLLNLLGLVKPSSGEEAIRYQALGTSLVAVEDEFLFEEQDEALLKKAVEQNNVQYVVMIIAKVAQVLKEAEAFDPNKK